MRSISRKTHNTSWCFPRKDVRVYSLYKQENTQHILVFRRKSVRIVALYKEKNTQHILVFLT
jgi:hypothetical protein